MKSQNAHGFLEEAVTTMRQRAQLRDAVSGERSMARTVAIFKAWTGIDLSEENGWRFMIALKQAREAQGKFNRDDYVDLAAYAGLLGECESVEEAKPSLATLLKDHVGDSPDPIRIVPGSDLSKSLTEHKEKTGAAPQGSGFYPQLSSSSDDPRRN